MCISARPKEASLEPGPIESRKRKGLKHWMLSIPPHLSENGKRIQKFYSIEGEAKTTKRNLCYVDDISSSE
jgi:hypothetical protein